MSLEQAIELIRNEYERAVKLDFVVNPLAYAIYQVWRKADKQRRRIRNEY